MKKQIFEENDYDNLHHGQKYTAIVDGYNIEGKVSIDDDGDIFLCSDTKNVDGAHVEDRLGYLYSWDICGGPESNDVEELFVELESKELYPIY